MACESIESTRKLRFPMSGAAALNQAVKGLIRKHYGHLPNGRKLVARAAGTSHRTAENWIAERNAPKLPEVILLMAANEELEQDLREMIQEIRCSKR